ncbi:hypothetical protein [Flocculibacter collagenilyticus]|uniref:hypothetical protein n=1 Tax=Flocculibacter collagenilyticus TaxID=2744479 RepID=UPI0018F62E1C|nr:hypothetical protein [Flocculibacter collagenilyticus]
MPTKYLMRFPDVTSSSEIQSLAHSISDATGIDNNILLGLLKSNKPLSFKNSDKALAVKRTLSAQGIDSVLSKKTVTATSQTTKPNGTSGSAALNDISVLKEVLSSQNDFITERIGEIYEEIQVLNDKVEHLISLQKDGSVALDPDETNDLEMVDDFSDFDIEIEEEPESHSIFSNWVNYVLIIAIVAITALLIIYYDELSQLSL